jgi:hypothetical protein
MYLGYDIFIRRIVRNIYVVTVFPILLESHEHAFILTWLTSHVLVVHVMTPSA